MHALPLLLAVALAADIKPTVDAAVEPVLKQHKTLGVVVGVRRHGKSQVFGYGTVETPAGKARPDGATLFEIGSITKTFTGVLLAEAVRRGEVKLDDPLTKHLPADIPFNAHKNDPPTLLQCATHRSGLPVQPPLIGLIARTPANPYAGFTRAKLAASLAETHSAKPGAKFVYSNLATGLLGHALVNAAHADSFEELVRERVCRPLRLRDMTTAPTGEQRARLAAGHNRHGQPTDPWDFATLEACGGMRSTANDLLKYAAANLGETDTPLKDSLLAAQKSRQDGGEGRATGLFWVRETVWGKAAVWHNGGTGGYRSMLLLIPKEKLAVVALCNADLEGAMDRIAFDVARAAGNSTP
jgi:D-alanyl-D-alanine-carboxypeptidase/D-alanyl-D-alanine-endopeptidase